MRNASVCTAWRKKFASKVFFSRREHIQNLLKRNFIFILALHK